MKQRSYGSDSFMPGRFSKDQPLPQKVSELKTIMEPFFGFTFDRIDNAKSELDKKVETQLGFLQLAVENAKQINIEMLKKYRLEVIFVDRLGYSANLPGLLSKRPRELAIAITKGITIIECRMKIIENRYSRIKTEFEQLKKRKEDTEKRVAERIRQMEEAQNKEGFLSSITPKLIQDAYWSAQVRQFNSAFMDDYENFNETGIKLERAINKVLELISAMDVGVPLFMTQLQQVKWQLGHI